jgi:hypothetical protein
VSHPGDPRRRRPRKPGAVIMNVRPRGDSADVPAGALAGWGGTRLGGPLTGSRARPWWRCQPPSCGRGRGVHSWHAHVSVAACGRGRPAPGRGGPAVVAALATARSPVIRSGRCPGPRRPMASAVCGCRQRCREHSMPGFSQITVLVFRRRPSRRRAAADAADSGRARRSGERANATYSPSGIRETR